MKLSLPLTTLLCALLAACGGSSGTQPAPSPSSTPTPTPTPAPVLCNGSEVLCERSFDQVAYATTHNAYSNEQDGFIAPNQLYNVTRQLEDGVRAMMLDVYLVDGVVTQCHSICDLGTRLLADTLGEILDFLEANPNEVISIIFENYVDGETVAAVFDDVGLTPFAHNQAPGDSWPTLGTMIDTNSRLVVFTDSGAGARSWYLGVWDHAFETHYSFETPEELSCDPNRGDPNSPLFIVNHFLTQTLGSPLLADQVNHNPLLRDRVDECAASNDAFPNFVTVDFYDIGDVLTVVSSLNE